MADLRISQLPADTTAADDDLFPFTSTQNSETRNIRADNLGIALARLGLRVGSGTPSSPANGDLWVDTTTNPPVLKVYNGASFTTVSFLPGSSVATSPGATAPSSPALGQLWQDTSQTPDQLKMFDGANFVRVDPLGITEGDGDARYLQITTAEAGYLQLSGGTLTGNLTLNGDPAANSPNMAANKNYVDTQIAAIPTVDPVPPGTIIWTARNTAPDGYLVADDTPYSRTTYAALFAAIGTQYGAGDGSTTFNVPDLRGQFVRGIDEPIGLNNPRGKDSGRQMGSDQGDQNKQHNHTITGGNLSYVSGVSLNKSTNAVDNSPDDVDVLNKNTSISVSYGTYTPPTAVDNDGGTEARPTNIALLGCIKY